ncbi:ribosomal protein S5 domain 2-type protein [Baffinella frigidus]|nr:ribosomal protein S5 domain 2-type protein [Cryptophyta sp. CCMP2293]
MVGCPRMPRVAAAVLVLLSLASAEVVQPQTCPGGVCPGVVPIDAVRGGFATDYGPVVANVVGTFKAKFGEDPTMVGVAPGHPPSLTANSPSYILVTRSDGRALQPPAQSLGIAAKGCGRVNLIGEHTDYNDGFVLPCAIDFHVAAAMTPAMDSDELTVKISLREPMVLDKTNHWSNYVRGVIRILQDEKGLVIKGGKLAIRGNVPLWAIVHFARAHPEAGPSLGLCVRVLTLFSGQEEKGLVIKGGKLAIGGNVPRGGGLSSSAALEAPQPPSTLRYKP